MKKYAYGWLTALFFLVSIAGHWIFGWFAYVDEQQTLHAAPQVDGYLVQMARDTAAEAIVTTEKDAVRLDALRHSEIPVYVAQLDVQSEDEVRLKSLLLRALIQKR